MLVIFNHQNKACAISDSYPSQHATKMRVTMAFCSEALKILNLYAKKAASLMNFISTLPELTTKAAIRGNIHRGFYEGSVID